MQNGRSTIARLRAVNWGPLGRPEVVLERVWAARHSKTPNTKDAVKRWRPRLSQYWRTFSATGQLEMPFKNFTLACSLNEDDQPMWSITFHQFDRTADARLLYTLTLELKKQNILLIARSILEQEYELKNV